MVFPHLLCLLGIMEARKLLDPGTSHQIDKSTKATTSLWTVKWFTVKLDHFTYSDTRSFQMKWLLNNTFYKPGGPVFFYTGNEAEIETSATSMGMMWDLAPRFKAAIIFAEHRFYGETMPFGKNSYTNIGNMGYLTSEQTLADFAALLFALKVSESSFNLYLKRPA
ncbi:hypothetical protein Y032_0035g3089 [Ancylostoma ceylanicum]|uniref:Serine carboxypeptidase S28 n=2 Tax=Ancylostoma ceylanicum TaxID=53326 RepID=A0A016UMB9_9BILA|nr:hypothetical protein Y032_0035g3089 [Ancylostoma ceylanicum]